MPPPTQLPQSPRLGRTLVILGALVALAFGVWWIMERSHYTVVPGTVSGSRASGLSGTFQMEYAGIWPTATAIESDGRGGACIAFLASDVLAIGQAPNSCSKDEDCDSFAGKVDAYYCDREGAGRCWVKPLNTSTQLCNRPVMLKDGEPAPVPKPENVAPLPPNVLRNDASARIIACINKTGANPQITGCGVSDGPDRVERMGPIATVN